MNFIILIFNQKCGMFRIAVTECNLRHVSTNVGVLWVGQNDV